MKNLALTLILLFCFACKDGQELSTTDASRIEGFWQLQTHPDWLYYFSDGYSEHRILSNTGAPDYILEYSFRTCADTIFLSNIHTSQIRVWVVRYIDAENAEVQEQTLDPIFPIYKLRRL